VYSIDAGSNSVALGRGKGSIGGTQFFLGLGAPFVGRGRYSPEDRKSLGSKLAPTLLRRWNFAIEFRRDSAHESDSNLGINDACMVVQFIRTSSDI
jgi:hypothetical protein